MNDRTCHHGHLLCAECSDVWARLMRALYRDEDHPSLQGVWPRGAGATRLDPRWFADAVDPRWFADAVDPEVFDVRLPEGAVLRWRRLYSGGRVHRGWSLDERGTGRWSLIRDRSDERAWGLYRDGSVVAIRLLEGDEAALAWASDAVTRCGQRSSAPTEEARDLRVSALEIGFQPIGAIATVSARVHWPVYTTSDVLTEITVTSAQEAYRALPAEVASVIARAFRDSPMLPGIIVRPHATPAAMKPAVAERAVERERLDFLKREVVPR